MDEEHKRVSLETIYNEIQLKRFFFTKDSEIDKRGKERGGGELRQEKIGGDVKNKLSNYVN